MDGIITPVVVSALITLAVTLVTILLARKTGLTDIQRASMTEGDRLREIQERRIEILEAQVIELKSLLKTERLAREAVESELTEIKGLLASNMVELLKLVGDNSGSGTS